MFCNTAVKNCDHPWVCLGWVAHALVARQAHGENCEDALYRADTESALGLSAAACRVGSSVGRQVIDCTAGEGGADAPWRRRRVAGFRPEGFRETRGLVPIQAEA